MEFIIDQIETLNVSDKEIFELLSEVYVQGGFTSPDTAASIFDPGKVRSRGILFVSRESTLSKFSGMVIVVPPDSKAIVMAKGNECEMHLLAVAPKFRGHGLGRALLARALAFAKESGWSKIILWTQKPMKEAQSLYESSGFVRNGEMERNGREFFIYERECT